MSDIATFTPGPWDAGLNEAEFLGESISITAGGAGSACGIATVLNAEEFPCLEENEVPMVDAVARANARLISAAPDLYAALEGVMNLIREVKPARSVSGKRGWAKDQLSLVMTLKRAVSALTKAKGEKS